MSTGATVILNKGQKEIWFDGYTLPETLLLDAAEMGKCFAKRNLD